MHRNKLIEFPYLIYKCKCLIISRIFLFFQAKLSFEEKTRNKVFMIE